MNFPFEDQVTIGSIILGILITAGLTAYEEVSQQWNPRNYKLWSAFKKFLYWVDYWLVWIFLVVGVRLILTATNQSIAFGGEVLAIAGFFLRYTTYWLLPTKENPARLPIFTYSFPFKVFGVVAAIVGSTAWIFAENRDGQEIGLYIAISAMITYFFWGTWEYFHSQVFHDPVLFPPNPKWNNWPFGDQALMFICWLGGISSMLTGIQLDNGGVWGFGLLVLVFSTFLFWPREVKTEEHANAVD